MAIDPYREWLGIPKSKQPPTLYRLVGVEDFEEDAARIHESALKQIARVRKHQAGKHSDLSQQLLNEISQARVRLLDTEQKGEYDIQLSLERRKGKSPRLRRWRITSAPGIAVASSIAGVLVVTAVLLSVFVQRPPEVEEVPTRVQEDSGVDAIPEPDATLQRVATLPGFRKLWQEIVADESAGKQFCRGDYDESSVPVDVRAHRLLLAAQSGRRLDLFLPMPKNDFRFLVHVSNCVLSAPTQSMGLAAFGAPSEYFGVLVQRPSAALRLAVRAPGETAISDQAAVAVQSPFWLDVRRTGNRWSAFHSIDGERFERIAERPIESFEPVAMGIWADNPALGRMQCAIDYLRVEGTDDEYVSKVKSWPVIPPLPDSNRKRQLFGGDFTINTLGEARLSYQFQFADAVAHWGDERTETTDGVLLRSGRTIEHGPIHRIRSVTFMCRFLSDRPATLELSFAGGGSLRLEAVNNQVSASDQLKREFNFEPKKDYVCHITVGGDDAVAFRVGSKSVLSGKAVGFTGPLATRVIGDGTVAVMEFSVEGRYDGLTAWMRTLHPETPRPSAATSTLAQGSKAANASLKTQESTLPPQRGRKPGAPRLVAGVNTASDENYPFLEAGGRVLHFTRSENGRDRLMFSSRNSTTEPFAAVAPLLGMPETGNQTALCVSPDRRAAIFASDHEGDFDLYVATRPTLEAPFESVTALQSTRSEDEMDETQPVIGPKGEDISFVRVHDDGAFLYFATRADDQWNFDDPERTSFRADFQRASVTTDGLQLYVQGPAPDDGRAAIYRSVRKSMEEIWPEPEIVPDYRAPSGKRGDLAPYVTPDGRELYFSSDRNGGAGGLDLWVVSIAKDGSESDARVTFSDPFDSTPKPVRVETKPAAPKTSPPAAKTKPAVAKKEFSEKPVEIAITDSIGEWLALGPISPNLLADANSAGDLEQLALSFVTGRLPEVGDESNSLRWRRATQFDQAPGIYVLVLPLLFREPCEMELSVEATPGGAFFWFDRNNRLTVRATIPWEKGGAIRSRADLGKQYRGRHRLVGVVCVPDASLPLTVRLIDSTTKEPAKGVIAEFEQ